MGTAACGMRARRWPHLVLPGCNRVRVGRGSDGKLQRVARGVSGPHTRRTSLVLKVCVGLSQRAATSPTRTRWLAWLMAAACSYSASTGTCRVRVWGRVRVRRPAWSGRAKAHEQSGWKWRQEPERGTQHSNSAGRAREGKGATCCRAGSLCRELQEAPSKAGGPHRLQVGRAREGKGAPAVPPRSDACCSGSQPQARAAARACCPTAPWCCWPAAGAHEKR